MKKHHFILVVTIAILTISGVVLYQKYFACNDRTPEGALECFVKALETGNTKKILQYIAAESQAEWQELLPQTDLKATVADYRRYPPERSDMATPNDEVASFDTTQTVNGEIHEISIMLVRERSGKWKVVDF